MQGQLTGQITCCVSLRTHILIPSIYIKYGVVMAPLHLYWKSRHRQTSGAYCLAALARSLNSRFRERLSQKVRWRGMRKTSNAEWLLTSMSTHVRAHLHTSVNSCTQTHTHRHKSYTLMLMFLLVWLRVRTEVELVFLFPTPCFWYISLTINEVQLSIFCWLGNKCWRTQQNPESSVGFSIPLFL